MKENFMRGKVVILYYYIEKQHAFNSTAYKYFSRDIRNNKKRPALTPLFLCFSEGLPETRGNERKRRDDKRRK